MEILLFELEEQQRKAAMYHLARSGDRREEKHIRRLRCALGSVLLRLGTAVSGADAGSLRPDVRQAP